MHMIEMSERGEGKRAGDRAKERDRERNAERRETWV